MLKAKARISTPSTGATLALESVQSSIPFSSGIDFGYVCVGKTLTKTLVLANSGTTTVRFNFEAADQHFIFTPSQGNIAPRQKTEVTVSFVSAEAEVLVAAIAVTLTAQGGEDISRVLKLSAMSKYPFIIVNTQFIGFESLLVGKVETRTVAVKNSSLVQTNINIEKVVDNHDDNSFSISMDKFSLAPQGEVKVAIKYTPQTAGNISCGYYKICSDGGNELNLSVRGEAEGFNVELSTNSV